jgi:hypothetical protein
MSTFTVSIDRTDLSLSALVIQGNTRQAGWNAMPGWQIPDFMPVVETASSPYLHGSVATGWRYQDGILSGDVFPVVADAAALATAVAEMRAALGRLSYTVTTNVNGDVSVWSAQPGSMTRSPLDAIKVGRNEPVWSLTIPVYPIPGA